MPGTVLLLDDDSAFRDLLRGPLRAAGHTVLEAARGADANRVLTDRDVDLVVVDGLLPDGDGLTWIRRLRAAGRRHTCVFVSAFFKDRATREKLEKELDVSFVVEKPVDVQVLVWRIDELLPTGDAMGTFDIEVELAELKKAYGVGIPARADAIAKAFEFAATTRTATDVNAVVLLTHNLAGTSGTHGFTAVSDAARKLERTLSGDAVKDPASLQAALHAARASLAALLVAAADFR